MKVESSDSYIKHTPKHYTFTKIVFFIFGVSSLSGWNAVLTALDFFSSKYHGIDVAFYFPVPLFISNFIIGMILPKIANHISLNFRLAWSLIGLCLILVLLPIIANALPNNTGFIISLVCIFLLGIFNSLQQNSAIGIAGVLGGEFIGIFFVGTGASGTIICIFRMICLASIPDNDGLSCLIYFIVASAWNIISIVLYFKFTHTGYYRKIISNENALTKHENNDQVSMQANQEVTGIESLLNGRDSQTDQASEEHVEDEAEQKQMDEITHSSVFKLLWYVNKLVFPIPPCIFLIYLLTFMMFPGVTLKINWGQKLSTWGPTLIIFAFNVGDLLGKQASNYRKHYNEKCMIILVILRFFFIYPFILIANQTLEQLWIPFVNISFFSFLNGYTTGGLMQIGPEKVGEHVRETVGFIQAFSLTSGIMFGSFTAVAFKNIK